MWRSCPSSRLKYVCVCLCLSCNTLCLHQGAAVQWILGPWPTAWTPSCDTVSCLSQEAAFIMRCESLPVINGRRGSGENNTVRKMRPEEGKGRKIFHPAVVLVQYEDHTQPELTAGKQWYTVVAIIIIRIVPATDKSIIAWNDPFHDAQSCVHQYQSDWWYTVRVYRHIYIPAVPVPHTHLWCLTGGLLLLQINQCKSSKG